VTALPIELAKIAVAAGLLGLAACSYLDKPSQDADAGFEMRPVATGDGGAVMFTRLEVTRAQWKSCYEAGGCSFLPNSAEVESGTSLPATGLNFFDVQEYMAWINRSTGKKYRLPTAAEWRIAASELPQNPYRKIFSDPRLAWAADYYATPEIDPRVRPSGGFGTFSNGISDLSGNVWEWTSSCVVDEPINHCPAFLAEGLHEAKLSAFVRDPAVGGCGAGIPPANVGFRLVREYLPTS
jgi:formylglycine-generating enzyme required for sulfatase activity